MALSAEIVDFVRQSLLNDASEARRVGKIPVMKDKPPVRLVRILEQVIDAIGVEER